MMLRGLFLADGASDEPLGQHLETLCVGQGFDVRVTTPDLRRLPKPPGLRVADRLASVNEIDAGFDI